METPTWFELESVELGNGTMGVSPTVADCKEADASTLEFPDTKTREPCREKDDGRVVKGRTSTARESSAVFVWPVAKAD